MFNFADVASYIGALLPLANSQPPFLKQFFPPSKIHVLRKNENKCEKFDFLNFFGAKYYQALSAKPCDKFRMFFLAFDA